MKAKIDRSGCISCGLCVEICPDIFEIAEDGLAKVHGEITAGNQDNAKKAMEGCPVNVISME